MSTEGIDYKVIEVCQVVDGDSVRLKLTRMVDIDNDWSEIIITKNSKGLPIRLIIVDTPERGQPGYADARSDLLNWLVDHIGRLRVELYESAGWDRVLGDIYVEGDRGNTATQHMLLKGWDPYLKS